VIVYNGFNSAIFSKDRRYRYALTRRFRVQIPPKSFVVIGINPSTADEATDDPTIRRCVAFAKREGASELVMVNLFAFVQTDKLAFIKFASRSFDRAVGDENERTINSILRFRHEVVVVCAWGTLNPILRSQAMWMRHKIELSRRQPFCFGCNADGSPKHPLYLAADTPLVTYGPTEAK